MGAVLMMAIDADFGDPHQRAVRQCSFSGAEGEGFNWGGTNGIRMTESHGCVADWRVQPDTGPETHP